MLLYQRTLFTWARKGARDRVRSRVETIFGFSSTIYVHRAVYIKLSSYFYTRGRGTLRETKPVRIWITQGSFAKEKRRIECRKKQVVVVVVVGWPWDRRKKNGENESR